MAMQAITGIDFGRALAGMPVLDRENGNRIFAALLASMFGVVVFGNLILGHGGAIKSSMAIGAVCVALVFAWYGLWRLFSHIAWSFAIVLLALAGAVYDSTGAGIGLVWVIAGVGGVLAVRHLRISKGDIGPVLLIGVMTAIVVIGTDGAYTSFDMARRAHGGLVHQDTLFHASIAAMIKNYGVASTGLNGLVEINYHTFSHVLMAAISKMSRQGVLETYGVAQAVLLVPLMMSSIVMGTVSLMSKEDVSIPAVFAALGVFLVAVPAIFGKWGFWSSYLISESYTLAITLLSFGLVPLYQEKLRQSDLALVALLTLLMTVAKVSVGAIYCGLWGLRYLFLRRGRMSFDLLVCAASVIAFLCIYFTSRGSSGENFRFHYMYFIEVFSRLGVYIPQIVTIEEYLSPSSVLLAVLAVLALFAFLLFHFFPAWLAIALCGHGATCKKRLEMPAVVYAAGAIAAGVLFTNFTLPGGAGYYFSNVSFFVSLPILLAAFSGWFNSQSRLNSPLLGGGRLIVMAALVALWVGAEGVYLRTKTSVPEANNTVVKHLVDIRKRSEIGQILSASDGMLKNNPLERCTARPFLYPAVSERPWANVLVVNDGCRFEWYGFEDYNIGPSQTRVVPAPVLRGLPIVQADSVRWSHKGRP